jgi:hypothetical protein
MSEIKLPEVPEGIDVVDYGPFRVKRTIHPGDTFELRYGDKVVASRKFEEHIVFNGYVIFKLDGAFGSDEGIGGIFLYREEWE